MKTLLLVAALATSACNNVGTCKDGTIYASLTLDGTVANADQLIINTVVNGVNATANTAHTPGVSTGTLEIDFSGTYPTGATWSVTINAYANNTLVGTGSASISSLPAGCAAVPVDIHAASSSLDLSTADLAMPDLATPDLSPPLVATARLIAPLSTSTVTQQQPTLRWELSAGGGAPTVQLCKDRACATPLSVTTTIAGNQLSAKPNSLLPPGWVYWNVKVVNGSLQTTTPTWQFWVGTTSASTAVDSSSGTVFDVNGDGYADFVVSARSAASQGIAHVYLGAASGPLQRIDIQNPDGANANFGWTVANVGDVNGDGFADFAVGTLNPSTAHLYLGGASPTNSDWNGVAPPKRIDFTSPDTASYVFGLGVGSIGDVDGDGYADFVINSESFSPAGFAGHLYYGDGNPSATAWNAATTSARLDFSAVLLYAVGDANGDGLADFAGASTAGAVYFGKKSRVLSDWTSAASTYRIDLSNGGISSPLGDVNGDGYCDFLMVLHVFLGSASPLATDWTAVSSTTRIDLTDPTGVPSSGFAVARSGGDLNGDGFSDFVVGANGTQAASVYFGSATLSAGNWNGGSAAKRLDLAPPDPSGSAFGSSVSGVGDIDGDGYGDVLVGAPTAASSTGALHIYMGGNTPATATWNGTSPSKRVDVTGPDGTGAAFGSSVD